MLPADAIGILNITYEIDAGGEHSPARDIEIVDPERDHRACSEEGMKFVGRNRALLGARVDEARPRGAADAREGREGPSDELGNRVGGHR
jgi:hypothetical protein